jgi:4-aminobutyrate---pyruvate transaminase
VRGVGLIAAVEIVQDKTTKALFDPAMMIAARVAKRAEAHGLIVRPLAGDVIAFAPPLIIKAGEIEEMLESFGKALDETWTWLQTDAASST